MDSTREFEVDDMSSHVQMVIHIVYMLGKTLKKVDTILKTISLQEIVYHL